MESLPERPSTAAEAMAVYEAERRKRGVGFGECFCGCGAKTGLVTSSHYPKCRVEGFPSRFMHGHNTPHSMDDYRAEDRGFETPCWIWLKNYSRHGYGQVRHEGRTKTAHRFYYEREHGPLPKGLHVDHLCRVRGCVRPSHLEAVTPAENTRRGYKARARH